jgi:hypothetical protein
MEMESRLKSRIWSSDPQTEFANPYFYSEQDLFLEEAESILADLLEVLQENNMNFTIDDRSSEKAIWMLHIDVLEALRQTTALLREKRHSIASRLFRDVLETIDLAAYFATGTDKSGEDLVKWYEDEVIPHRRSRSSLGQRWGATAENTRREQYQNWSRFTHRSYWAVKQSFGKGHEERIWHDSILSLHGACIPQVVASYLPILGDLIVLFIIELGLHSPLATHSKYCSVVAGIPPLLIAWVGFSYLPSEACIQTPAADG